MFNNFAYLTKIFRKRSLNNNKYDPQTVQLLQKTYAILVRHAENKRSCLKRRDGVPPGLLILLFAI